MSYRMAGIDVHKRMLAVVIADVAADGDYEFTRRRVSTYIALGFSWTLDCEKVLAGGVSR